MEAEVTPRDKKAVLRPYNMNAHLSDEIGQQERNSTGLPSLVKNYGLHNLLGRFWSPCK